MGNNIKEIKTTIVGTVFLLIGLVITVYEYFTVQNMEWEHHLLPIGFAVAGIGFLFAPDRVLDIMFGALEKIVSALFGWLKKRA